MNARPIVDVAVGVVIRPSDGWILIGQRPPGKPFEGWWEFPGGKFDPGEGAAEATARELDEELGIQVFDSQPWVVREHVYEHAHVRLHFRRVTHWQGQPQSREGQAFAWCHPAHVDVSPLLPASLAPIQWLGLPATLAISNASEMGAQRWLKSLDAWLASGQPGILLLREPGMAAAAVLALCRETLAVLRGTGVRLLVSSRHPRACIDLAAEHASGGVHLTGQDLLKQLNRQGRWLPGVAPQPEKAGGAPDCTMSRAATAASSEKRNSTAKSGNDDDTSFALNPLRPAFPLVGASCHSPADLQRAGDIGADLAVFGPVQATRSHPGAQALGWEEFARLIARTPVPVFALGGLTSSDLDRARQAGAHGIAMQRSIWV